MSFPATLSKEEQQAEVQRRVQSYLNTKTQEFGGLKLLADAYDVSTLDPSRPIQYSQEIVQPSPDSAAAASAVLHRPLMALLAWVFSSLFDVHSLADEGLCPQGNCVVHQLAILTKTRGKPLWQRGELERLFDTVQEELYGEYHEQNPYWDPEADCMQNWRTQGITAAMALEVCRQQHVPLCITWGNSVIQAIQGDGNRNVDSQVLQISGQHAFFVKDSKTKEFLARSHSSLPSVLQESDMLLLSRPRKNQSHIEDWILLTTFFLTWGKAIVSVLMFRGTGPDRLTLGAIRWACSHCLRSLARSSPIT